MIIAHGPLGYLLAYTVRKRWPFPRWYYWFGISGGIFPDIDLFYFYLVDSTLSHHQFITHSLLPYMIILAIGWLIKPIRFPVILFALGCISHVLADVFTGYVAVFMPFTNTMIGLPAWGYNLVTGGLAELVIILLTLGTIMNKSAWIRVSMVSLIVIGVVFIWVNQHTYKPSGAFYYNDTDHDGILNVADRDLDGDGRMNMIDSDIDNDGQDNSFDFYLELFSAEGALFDYSFGHFIEIPLRVGLVNDVVIVQRMFANSGIFFSTEMMHDYAVRSDGYIFDPTDNRFTQEPDNILTWLEHTNHALSANTPRQEFDLIFFQSGQIAVFTRLNGEDVVLDVAPSHSLADYRSLIEVANREGGIQAIGRILPKPFQKRY